MTDLEQPPGGDPLTYGNHNTSVESSSSKKYNADGKLVPHKQGKKRVQNMVIIGIAALLILMIGIVVLIVFLPGGEEDSSSTIEETPEIIEPVSAPLSDEFLPLGSRCKRGFTPTKATKKDLFNFEEAELITVNEDCK